MTDTKNSNQEKLVKYMTTQERIAKFGPEEAMNRTYGERESGLQFLPKTKSLWSEELKKFITLHVYPSKSFRFPKHLRATTRKGRLEQKRAIKDSAQ